MPHYSSPGRRTSYAVFESIYFQTIALKSHGHMDGSATLSELLATSREVTARRLGVGARRGLLT
jgi:hypothetical protein